MHWSKICQKEKKKRTNSVEQKSGKCDNLGCVSLQGTQEQQERRRCEHCCYPASPASSCSWALLCSWTFLLHGTEKFLPVALLLKPTSLCRRLSSFWLIVLPLALGQGLHKTRTGPPDPQSVRSSQREKQGGVAQDFPRGLPRQMTQELMKSSNLYYLFVNKDGNL